MTEVGWTIIALGVFFYLSFRGISVLIRTLKGD